MTPTVWGQLKVRLQTLDGFPVWTDKTGGILAENYFADLQDIPDPLVLRMVAGIGRRYDRRPSAKHLREWASEMAQSVPSDMKQLTGYSDQCYSDHSFSDDSGGESLPVAYRGGSVRLEAPVGGVAAYAAQVLPPPAAREIIARLKQKGGRTADGPCEYGLQFEILPGFAGEGRIMRTHHGYTKPAADKAAEERNAKWPHQRTTVFHKTNPLPVTNSYVVSDSDNHSDKT